MATRLVNRVALLFIVMAAFNACRPGPASRGPSLAAQSTDQVYFGPPAIPGVDGPLGMTQPDVPAEPWSLGPPIYVTTAELMALGSGSVRDRSTSPRLIKILPDRSQLPDNPFSEPAAQWPPSPQFPDGGSPAAFTGSTPNADVAFLPDTGFAVPPDTMGDVGPTQYLVALNGRVRTISKATGIADGVLNLDSDTFYGAARNGRPTGDPRVRYDRRVGRWYVLMFNIAVPNRYLLAVSNTATISGSTIWAINFWNNTRTQGGVGGAAGCLGDYPTLGVDEDALYVGVNQFCGTSLNTVTFDSTSAYVLPKAPLLAGAGTVATFDALATGSTAGPVTPQGVDNFDSGTNEGYIIGVDIATFGTLMLRRVANPATAPSLSANVPITVPVTRSPANVPQPGGVRQLDGIDDRLMNAVIRTGQLWTVHQIGVDTAGVGSTTNRRTAERWYQLGNLSGAPVVTQSGTVFDSAATNPLHHWMGSIMVNGQGHAALGASRGGASASGHVNTVFTGRLASAALGTMEAVSQYSANTSVIYNAQASASVQRWGDYSYTSVDPNDDMTMWTLQEYPNASNNYAVRLIRLLAPPPAAIASLSPNTVATGQTGLVISVTGTSVGGSGFFDPGAGFASRIAAAFSGTGVAVTNVVVNSPTSLTLTINTVGAAAGARTLTVTNPDGQVSSLASALTIGSGAAGPPISTDDSFSTPFATPLVIAAPGVLANDNTNGGGAMSALLGSSTSSGTLALAADGGFNYTPGAGFVGTDTFTYRASTTLGTGNLATVSITVAAPTGPLPPSNFRILNMVGNDVTFAWTLPAFGPAPTALQLEGGLAPGSVLGTISLGVVPAATITLPTGSYFIRLRTIAAAGTSGPSNEVLTHVNVPVAPSAPANLLGLVNGSNLSLAWRPTFGGGAPTAVILDVTGTLSLSLPMGPTDVFSFAGVPAGTYTFTVRQVNAGGPSGPSSPVTLAFPGACSGAPQVPSDVLAFKSGSQLGLFWSPPLGGPAPTGYTLNVTGSFVGSLPMASRALVAAPPPGTYTLSIVGTNPCGPGAASAPQTLTFP